MERPVRASVFVLCALPFAWLLYGAVYGGLGPDPGEALMHSTGEWSLRILAMTLLMSPLRVWTGKPWVIKLRRMLGLYAFFYATIHFTLFLQFYTGWAGAALLQELVERPYVSAGFAAWCIMLPLAITSTRGMRRRLGQRWIKLHRQIYVAAIIACIHLLWQARSDIGEALAYLLVFGLLLAWRFRRALKANSRLKPGKV
ncbi:sulfite oxidase heme-binding subunit YedZ [Candidatus Marimicrobium litorale]|uniref:Protein-methionine-sulfoxide reductase heme-binding subunit MsrQ n=1 Tax=Candidatus Marimicrobium litorale TaxID=2518991 RepID=A0ABT3TBG3_9GAMM|nr:sulfoxide reductase heme-binding subunit YedZ [Candidatus Marimicrobium litorale]MCX2979156.1 sulfoxide reductase heme-binding subunit YedZ [Candidatus Marimicrobium litorale]